MARSREWRQQRLSSEVFRLESVADRVPTLGHPPEGKERKHFDGGGNTKWDYDVTINKTEKSKDEMGMRSQRLDNNRGIVDPGGVHVQRQNPRNTLRVLSPDRLPEKFKGQICFARRPLFLRGLRDHPAPLINHALFVREGTGPEVCESIGAQDKKSVINVGAKLPVSDFGFGRDIRWRDIPIEKLVPGRGVAISREDVVQDLTSELGRLLKRDIADTLAKMSAWIRRR